VETGRRRPRFNSAQGGLNHGTSNKVHHVKNDNPRRRELGEKRRLVVRCKLLKWSPRTGVDLGVLAPTTRARWAFPPTSASEKPDRSDQKSTKTIRQYWLGDRAKIRPPACYAGWIRFSRSSASPSPCRTLSRELRKNGLFASSRPVHATTRKPGARSRILKKVSRARLDENPRAKSGPSASRKIEVLVRRRSAHRSEKQDQPADGETRIQGRGAPEKDQRTAST